MKIPTIHSKEKYLWEQLLSTLVDVVCCQTDQNNKNFPLKKKKYYLLNVTTMGIIWEA